MNDLVNQYSELITGIILLGMVFELIRSKTRPSIVFGLVVLLFLILGYITVDSIFKAITTKSVLIVFLVIGISSVINNNFDIGTLLDRLLGRINSQIFFLAALCLSVAFISSVFNNTPVVIILIPYVMKKAESYEISPSKLLIPLSFSAILGGMITLVGTSTNLVLNGLLENSGLPLFKIYDFLIPGLLVTVSGVLYLALFSSKLLPSRSLTPNQKRRAARNYFVEAKIGKGSSFSGKSLEESGVKDYKGVSLIELVRGEKIFNVVASRNLILEEDDRLIFSGSIKDVLLINQGDNNLEFISQERLAYDNKLEYVELSIPTNSNLDGKRIKDTDFRTRYGATILAVHRNGEDLSGRIGQIVLRSGDLLIIVPHANLTESIRSDFYILSNITKRKESPQNKKKLIFGVLALIALFVFEKIDLFLFLTCSLGLMVVLKYATINELKNEFRVNLFVVLCASIIVGEVFISSGLAKEISTYLLLLVQPYGFTAIILGLMLFTIVLTSFITNVAAVSIAFPLAYSISEVTGIQGEALFLAVAFAASAAFMTPIGYQTNLVVMAPGDYRFKDFFKIGAPLTVIYLAVIMSFIYIKYNI